MSNKNNNNPASLFRIAGAVVKSAKLPISDLPKTVQDCFVNPCCFHVHYDYWSSEYADDAAAAGHIDCLDYARKHGYAWNSVTTELAAREGHLSTLAHAHSNGCPMDSDCLDAAMDGGHLECVKYAHENGCNWSTYSLTLAINNEEVECFKYAYENGAPYNNEDVMDMLTPGVDDEILDYLYVKGHNHPSVDRDRIFVSGGVLSVKPIVMDFLLDEYPEDDISLPSTSFQYIYNGCRRYYHPEIVVNFPDRKLYIMVKSMYKYNKKKTTAMTKAVIERGDDIEIWIFLNDELVEKLTKHNNFEPLSRYE